MIKPPFKLATPLTATAALCCAPADGCATRDAAITPGRARLAELHPHLHCSVIGTCLSTADLRKLMARYLFVRDSTDLEVHHEAVALAGLGGHVAKALHKLLDQRHEAVVQRFTRAHDAPALAALWDDALRQGDVPGAYWAVLTHRQVTPALRQQLFGDVHMLLHLVGAANRADIRRLVTLERDNAELRDRAERQQQRGQETLDERDRLIAALRQQLAAAAPPERVSPAAAPDRDERVAAERVALQTQRREHAEQVAAIAEQDAARLRDELEHLGRHAQALSRELAAAEAELRVIGDGATGSPLSEQLNGRRILYVGGRPSSTPAIRDLVLRHGGDFQRHDGGLEDRKGLLAPSVAWAQLVVFPVDCVDHDSVGMLKRLCARHGVGFVALRSASVASFAAGLLGATA